MIKIFVSALTVFFCIAVRAEALPGPDASWDAIRAHVGWTRLKIVQPAVAGTFGPQGFFNACVDGDVFRSVEPVKVCIQWKEESRTEVGGGEGSGVNVITNKVCVRSASENISLDRNQTLRGRCLNYVYSHRSMEEGGTEAICTRWATDHVRLSVNPGLQVFGYERTGSGPGGTSYGPTKLLFTKAYRIPSCR